MAGFRFRPEHRLRSPEDFATVYKRKCSVADDWLIIYARSNALPHMRLGLSVSRKYGNAVRRNRLRRLYREAFRLVQPELPLGIDIVLIPRTKKAPSLVDLQTSLTKLLPKLHRRLAKRKATAPPVKEESKNAAGR